MPGDNLIFSPEDHMITKIDYASSTINYIGRANPGAATSDSKWQIRRFTNDSQGRTTDIQFANGLHAFTNVWDSRTTYQYS